MRNVREPPSPGRRALVVVRSRPGLRDVTGSIFDPRVCWPEIRVSRSGFSALQLASARRLSRSTYRRASSGVDAATRKPSAPPNTVRMRRRSRARPPIGGGAGGTICGLAAAPAAATSPPALATAGANSSFALATAVATRSATAAAARAASPWRAPAGGEPPPPRRQPLLPYGASSSVSSSLSSSDLCASPGVDSSSLSSSCRCACCRLYRSSRLGGHDITEPLPSSGPAAVDQRPRRRSSSSAMPPPTAVAAGGSNRTRRPPLCALAPSSAAVTRAGADRHGRQLASTPACCANTGIFAQMARPSSDLGKSYGWNRHDSPM